MEILSYKNIIELWNVYTAKWNQEQAKILEKTVRVCLGCLIDDWDLIRDCTEIRNFKNRKGQHEPDFVIYDEVAVIETKNWDCYARSGYTISETNVKKEILRRFESYPKFRRILVIARPRWGKGAKELLDANGVTIIEIGYLVTEDNWMDACLDIWEPISKLVMTS